MMSGAWGCPNEYKGQCLKVKGQACDPGMKGCVLHGRFRFANSQEKNDGIERRRRAEQHRRSLKPQPGDY